MRVFVLFLISIFALGVVAQPEEAHARKKVYRKTQVSKAQPQDNPKYAAFVVDGDTGKILFQEDADKLRYPASLTKMMTLYLLFEALENGKLRMETRMPVSQYAASRPATNLFMQEGDSVVVRDAILALIIRSANDVAVVTAETIGGSEENFARIMTQRARQLGMKNTTFRNASGLHDPKQVTTAKDMALLGIAVKKHFPQYFHFFSRDSFTFEGKTYTGHNRVTRNYPGADGLKTGFVNASGFNLVTTASRRGVNLVGVVLGGRTYASRDAQMVKLLDQGFAKSSSFKSKNYVGEYPGEKSREKYDAANDNIDTGAAEAQVAEEVASSPVAAAAAVAAQQSAPAPTAPQMAAAAAAPAEPSTGSRLGHQQMAAANTSAVLQTEDTNTYVRKMADPQAASKAERIKSDMIVQPFSGNFVPYPKSKPRI